SFIVLDQNEEVRVILKTLLWTKPRTGQLTSITECYKKLKTYDISVRRTQLVWSSIGDLVDKELVNHVKTTKRDPDDQGIIAKQAPHGNSKSSIAHNYRRSLPSITTKIAEAVKSKTAADIYEQLISTASADEPRNLPQVKYQRQKHLKKQRLSNDELFNAVQLSYQINNFIRVCSFLDLATVFMHEQGEEQFSTLLARTPVLISDGELAFKNAFHSAFPKLHHIRCLNHYRKSGREISGSASNGAESINAKVKRWIEWKETSVDTFIQKSYLCNFHLTSTNKCYEIEPSTIPTVTQFDPEKILIDIRERAKLTSSSLSNAFSTFTNSDTNINDNNNDSNDNESQNAQQRPSQTGSTPSSPQLWRVPESMTRVEKARLLFDLDLVSFDSKAKVLNMRSTDHQNVYTVHFHDRKCGLKCSCASRMPNCSHITI
ncbi:unnamed protein product, partial [Didymodactylos carnosus]